MTDTFIQCADKYPTQFDTVLVKHEGAFKKVTYYRDEEENHVFVQHFSFGDAKELKGVTEWKPLVE